MCEKTDLTFPINNESILQILFDHYFESKRKDTKNVENAYRNFCHSLLEIDPIVVDEIMSAAAVLCLEHERAAFVAGAKTIGRLQLEISEPNVLFP